MKYPLEKYKFYIVNKPDGSPYQVIAISTYAGKTVRGVAKCHDSDTFSLDKGKMLAAARCNLKIAEKRLHRADTKCSIANRQVGEAKEYQTRMRKYYDDSKDDLKAAEKELKKLIKSM